MFACVNAIETHKDDHLMLFLFWLVACIESVSCLLGFWSHLQTAEKVTRRKEQEKTSSTKQLWKNTQFFLKDSAISLSLRRQWKWCWIFILCRMCCLCADCQLALSAGCFPKLSSGQNTTHKNKTLVLNLLFLVCCSVSCVVWQTHYSTATDLKKICLIRSASTDVTYSYLKITKK